MSNSFLFQIKIFSRNSNCDRFVLKEVDSSFLLESGNLFRMFWKLSCEGQMKVLTGNINRFQ